MARVLAIADRYDGQLRKATFQTLGFTKALLDAAGGGDFAVALLGGGSAGDAAAVAGYGATAVHVAEDAALADYTAAAWAPAIAALARQLGATHVVMTSGTQGKDLLPRVAALLEAGMAADVLSVQSDGAGGVTYKRPMWAGNVVATVAVDTPVHVVSVRATEFSPAEATGGASPVQPFGAGDGAPDTRFVAFQGSAGERPDLGEAERVVSGGRGLGSKDNFWSVVTPLADVLGAAIGATRAAVDSDYAPNELQVGQTGRAVAPDLYFAIAISGAIQHLAGMKNSKCIVAINKDPDAPIFQVADYGLVADAFKAVPELVEKLRGVV